MMNHLYIDDYTVILLGEIITIKAVADREGDALTAVIYLKGGAVINSEIDYSIIRSQYLDFIGYKNFASQGGD